MNFKKMIYHQKSSAGVYFIAVAQNGVSSLKMDSVSVTVDFPAGTSVSVVSSIADAWQDWVDTSTSVHVWQHEPLIWHVAVSPPRLFAHVRYGDNVDDEWLVAWLAVALGGGSATKCSDAGATAAAAEAVIQLQDSSDGDFVLVECADALPRWATSPSATKNRTLFYKNNLHLVSPRQLAGDPPPFPAAASYVREHAASTLAPKTISASALGRLHAVFPSLSQLRHRARILLPPGVAQLLLAEPSLVSDATDAFLSREPTEALRAAALTLLSSFDLLRKHVDDNRCDEQLVPMTVTFSRSQYAQLSCERFAAPPRSPYGKAGVVNRQTLLARDIGLKLATGFEVIMLRSPDCRAALGAASEARDRGDTAALDELHRRFSHAHVTRGLRNSEAVEDEDSEDVPRFRAPSGLIVDVAIELNRPSRCNKYRFPWPPEAAVDENLNWMSPENAEQEVTSFIERTARNSNTAHEESATQARTVVEALSGFVGKVSSFEGVDMPSSAADADYSGDELDGSSQDEDGDSDDEAASVEEKDDQDEREVSSSEPRPFVMTQSMVLSLINSAVNRLPLEEDVQRAVAGLARFPEDGAMVGIDDPTLLSQQDDGFQAFMATMDSELLSNINLDRVGLGEGDIAQVIASSVEASVTAQAGTAGPASVLLGGLGVDVPATWWRGEH